MRSQTERGAVDRERRICVSGFLPFGDRVYTSQLNSRFAPTRRGALFYSSRFKLKGGMPLKGVRRPERGAESPAAFLKTFPGRFKGGVK